MSLSSTCTSQSSEVDPLPALAELKPVLIRFQKRSASRALIQVANSLLMYVLLWCAIYWSWRFSYALTLCLMFLAGLWVVRVFIIMHDCGHGSFTQSKLANNIIGNIAGLMVFTPYYHWRWEHAIHHNTSGDLGRRGIGDVWTMTVEEYLNSSRWRRFIYAVTRDCPLIGFSLCAPRSGAHRPSPGVLVGLGYKYRGLGPMGHPECGFRMATISDYTTAHYHGRRGHWNLVVLCPASV